MVARWPGAFLLSSFLHGAVAAAIVLLGWAVVEQQRPSEIMTFVGVVAPAAQASVDSPGPALRVMLPPSSPRAVSAPVVATPVEEPARAVAPRRSIPVAPAATGAPAPSHRVAASTPRRMTKAEYDARRGPTASTVSRVEPRYVDGTGIADELKAEAAARRGDSSTDGPIGPETYLGRLEAALGAAIERHGGLVDGLTAVAEYHILSDGHLTRVRLLTPSGDAEFDRVLRETIADFVAGPRPADVPEVRRTTFHTRAR